MIAALEVPVLRERARALTLSQYHVLVERNEIDGDMEFLDGVLIEKMPKSPKQERIVMKLMQIIGAALPAGYFARKEGPLTIDNSEPEPDISVVTGSIDDYAEVHPTTAELVIEVVISRYDLDHAKGSIYARGKVKEYVIVDVEGRRILVFSGSDSSKFVNQGESTKIATLNFANIEINLADLL